MRIPYGHLWVLVSKQFLQRYSLVFAALGLPNMDKAPVKIQICPFQLEQLPPPHAVEQGHPHKVRRLIVMSGINRFSQGRQLLRVKVLSSEVIYLGHFSSSLNNLSRFPDFFPRLPLAFNALRSDPGRPGRGHLIGKLPPNLFLKNLAALLKPDIIDTLKTVAADTFGFPIKTGMSREIVIPDNSL